MLSKTCNLLIEKGLDFHPTYAGGKFSVHLPMSLVALDKMNASEEQLTNFYSNSIEKFRVRDKKNTHKEIISLDDALGQRDYFEDYLKFFKSRLSETTTQDVLTESIPVLISGMSASAFHPIIRLSYALETENKAEVAMALASWASEYLAFDTGFDQTRGSLEDIIIGANPVGINHNFSPGNISDRMKEIGAVLKNKGVSIQPEEISLNAIRAFSLNAFIKQNNFTLLHMVTGCFAFRTLLDYVSNLDRALRYLWEAVVIAYLSTGSVYEPSEIEVKDLKEDWKQIIKGAANSQDDHVIKLVYTSWKEHEYYRSDAYTHVAERALK